MQLVATPLLLLSLGAGAFELGVAYALQFGPILLLAPLGGALADRFDKRRWLMTLQAITAVQALTFVVVIVTGSVSVWHVFALAAMLGMVNASEMPTRVSFVAELVPDREISNAVGLMLVAMNASRVIGPALAGILAAIFGYAANFTWSLLAAITAVILVGRIDGTRTRSAAQVSGESVLRSVQSAIRHIGTSPTLKTGLGLLAAFGLFGVSFQTVAPIYAIETLGMDGAGYGFLIAAMGIGALAAALPMTLISTRQARGLMFLAPIAFGVLLAFLALNRMPMLAFVLIVPLGFFYVLINSTINVTVQGTVDHEFRGRTMGIYVSIMHGGGAIGALLMGTLTALLGAPTAMLIGTAGIVISTAVLRIRRPEWSPQPPATPD
jgi:predicted MFS family arabinose efflux permease